MTEVINIPLAREKEKKLINDKQKQQNFLQLKTALIVVMEWREEKAHITTSQLKVKKQRRN